MGLTLIKNKHTNKAIFWTVLGLSLRASSTIWVSMLLNGGISPVNGIYLLISLMLFYLISSIPDTKTFGELAKSELESTKNYTEKFQKSYKNSPQLMIDNKFRNAEEPFLVGRATVVFKDALTVGQSMVLSTSAILVDALTMSVIVSPYYGIAYGGSILLFFGTKSLFQNKIKQLASKSLSENNQLNTVLSSGWDNIVIGNEYNEKLWNEKFKLFFKNSKEATVNYVMYLKNASSVGTLLSSLPILGTTVYLFQTWDISKIPLLLAVLPRQLQTVQFFNMYTTSASRLSGVQRQLKELEFSIQGVFEQTRYSPVYRIYWNKLQFVIDNQPVQYENMKNCLEQLSRMKKGRITLRGGNGLGKSVFLCKLKSYLQSQRIDAFYLPASARLVFNANVEDQSSGQKMLIKINEILTQTNSRFILLDEWDSNLADENIELISNKLNEISKTHCVIEIRHRQDRHWRALFATLLQHSSVNNHLPVRKLPLENVSQEFYELESISNGSSLFHGVIFSRLLPLINDAEGFNIEALKLFGESIRVNLDKIRGLFVKYDGTLEFVRKNPIVDDLINTNFRKELVNYLRKNKVKFEKHHAVELSSFDQYCDKLEDPMYNIREGFLEVIACSNFLNCKINFYQVKDGNCELLQSVKGHDEVIQTIHLVCDTIEFDEDTEVSYYEKYHFNFLMSIQTWVPPEKRALSGSNLLLFERNKEKKEDNKSREPNLQNNENKDHRDVIRSMFNLLEEGNIDEVHSILKANNIEQNLSHPDDSNKTLFNEALKIQDLGKRIGMITMLIERIGYFCPSFDRAREHLVDHRMDRAVFIAFKNRKKPAVHDEQVSVQINNAPVVSTGYSLMT